VYLCVVYMLGNEVSTNVYKWIGSLSNRLSVIIGNFIDHMKFSAYMAFIFITFFPILLVPFLSLHIWLYFYGSF